jgi:hypothetical protein
MQLKDFFGVSRFITSARVKLAQGIEKREGKSTVSDQTSGS